MHEEKMEKECTIEITLHATVPKIEDNFKHGAQR